MLQNRIECQLRTACTPRTAREWGHCIVRHTPGMTPEMIAAQTGIPLKRLMKISAPTGDAQARIEEIAAITRVTGRYDWLRFYARQAGCEIFPLPPCTPGEMNRDVLEQTSASIQSLASVVSTLTDIVADRHVTPREVEETDDVIDRHFATVNRMRAYVHEHVEQPASGRRVS